MPMMESIKACCSMPELAFTAPMEMMMISADRMKSVRIAPLILAFSSGNSSGTASGEWPVSWRCRRGCSSFSTPSKQRYAPPSISSGVISAGASHDSRSVAGIRISLFASEPLATRQTMGSSRSADTPVTWLAFKAKSSPTTPTVFFAAILVIRETSSSTDAMSSSRVNRDAKAI